MSNIDIFKSRLTGGGARANQFSVSLNPPTGITTGLVPEAANFMVKAAALPGQAITEIPVNFRGRQLFVAGDRTFEPWAVTVINDVEFSVRNAMEQWQLDISQLDSGIGATNNDYLLSRAFVEQLNKDDTVLARYEFFNMFPQSIGAIELNMGTADEVETFEISFDYSHWERVI